MIGDSITYERFVKGKRRTETRYAVACPNCGHVRYLKVSDLKRTRQCRSCACSAAGKRGYEATCAKHGKRFGLEFVQSYKRDHRSSLEAVIDELLTDMGLPYETEVLLPQGENNGYLLDYVIYDQYVIEVDGEWVHQWHTSRDVRKHNAIRAAGYRLLVLDERDLPHAAQHIAHFLNLKMQVVA